MTTIPIVERLIPVSLVYATVYFGVADREHKDHAETLDLLNRASEDELAGLPLPKRESATRHSWRASQAILKPFIDRGESCAKFGLALFYALRQLIDEGRYELRDGPFSDAMDAVLNPDGTVTEMANIDGIDRSAQKMGRKIVRELMEMGYYGKKNGQ